MKYQLEMVLNINIPKSFEKHENPGLCFEFFFFFLKKGFLFKLVQVEYYNMVKYTQERRRGKSN